MSALLAQAQQVQQQLMEAQEALANSEVHGQAGGGLVQVTILAHDRLGPLAGGMGGLGLPGL